VQPIHTYVHSSASPQHLLPQLISTFVQNSLTYRLYVSDMSPKVICPRFETSKLTISVGLGRQLGIGLGVQVIRWGNDDSGA
jgi:hypothetical protein